MYVKGNTDERQSKRCRHGKSRSSKYSGCVSVSLVTHHAIHTRRNILPSVACLALLYFPKLSNKQHYFGKKLLNI